MVQKRSDNVKSYLKKVALFKKNEMETIREVKIEDANDILDIYNYYITNTIVTFDEEKKSLDDIKLKISEITTKYPWYVMEYDNHIVAFAYASLWKDKSAYNKSVEATVYVKAELHGKGYGKKMYKNLIDKLSKNGYHSIVGVISLPNDESIRLHEKFNFESVKDGTVKFTAGATFLNENWFGICNFNK